MSELTDWLLEAIAADEAVARAATPGPWRLADLPGSNEVWADRDVAGYDAFMVATTATRLNQSPGVRGYEDARHIAAHDPARVLAECAAKKAIVELHAPRLVSAPGTDGMEWSDWDCAVCDLPNLDYPCPTIRALASVFRDRPGWRPEWGTE